MPKLVFCPFCNKSLLTSTYGTLHHINICETNIENIENKNFTIQEIKKSNNLDEEKSIKKQIIFNI